LAAWNIGIYSKSVTESSKSVLIEVLRVLGSYRDYLVLTGGWAPYFVLRYYKGGPKKVAEEVRSFIDEPVVAEALEEIRDKFRTVRSEGPFQVAYFLAQEDERLRERIQGEAYAVLSTFFNAM